MTASIEREIKLRFESSAAARQAASSVGAAPLRERRLQDDMLFDWPDGRLARAGHALRVRQESGTTTLTLKGPPQPGIMKVREELETQADHATVLIAILERLGLRVCFRYQKYRQEFSRGRVIVAIDETPVGTFMEIEGQAEGIIDLARELGREPSDFILDSYRALFLKERAAAGLTGTDMVFGTESGGHGDA